MPACRTLIVASAIAATLVAAAALAAPPAAAADLTVTAYGGIWEKAIRECYVKPFEARTGKTADVVLGGPPQWMNQVAANRDKPPIDIFMNSIDNAWEAVDKALVDEVGEKEVPALKDVPEKFRTIVKGYGVLINYGAAGIIYNTRTVKNPPKSWKEFVERTMKGEWTAALPGINYAGMAQILIWNFADLYGGGVTNVQPALDVIKKLKDSKHLLFWNDVNLPLNQLQSGDIDIALYWDGRAWAFKDEGHDWVGFINPEPGAIMNPVVIQKVKNGSPLAWQYMDVALSPGPQGCFANMLQYGVANEKATYSDKVRPRITDWQATRWPPFREMPSELPKWVEMWNKQIGG
ncbi:MAG: extracellular solute-binding protein [Alphaproteobacteria bacterium]